MPSMGLSQIVEISLSVFVCCGDYNEQNIVSTGGTLNCSMKKYYFVILFFLGAFSGFYLSIGSLTQKNPQYGMVWWVLVASILFALLAIYILQPHKWHTRNEVKKERKPKSIKDFLKETTFTFDQEDENLLVSKKNPKLRIRIRKNHNDSIYVGFNFAHQFSSVEVGEIKSRVLETEKIYYVNDTHRIQFDKGEGAKWIDFGQELVEEIFKLYEEKYPIQR